MPLKDLEAKRAHHRKYIKNRYWTDPQYRANQIAASEKNREDRAKIQHGLIDDIKSAGCVICGEKERCCLSFHHMEPEKKSFTISARKSKSTSHKRFVEELKKCILVCENCHRKIHAGIIEIGRNIQRSLPENYDSGMLG